MVASREMAWQGESGKERVSKQLQGDGLFAVSHRLLGVVGDCGQGKAV